jgi:hypothetical protein
MSSLLLLERLSDEDLAMLARAGGDAAGSVAAVSRLRADPARIGDLIERPEVYRAMFRSKDRDRLVFATPFLAFSVLLAQTARELAEARFVYEWAAPRRRVPVFDAASLRGFVGKQARRLFLAELLSSYTHVASGTVWARSSGRWRKHRFSELDPVELAWLAEVVPEWERPAVYRRLGDLALFLTGVFPDHAGGWLGARKVERISRALAWGEGTPEPGRGDGALDLLEGLGRRAYELAAEASEAPRTVPMVAVLAELPARFTQARRVLNFLTDRHLFPLLDRWFPLA